MSLTSVQLRHLAGAMPCWRPARQRRYFKKKLCKTARKKHPKQWPKSSVQSVLIVVSATKYNKVQHPQRSIDHRSIENQREPSFFHRPHWLDGPKAPQSVAFRRSKHPAGRDFRVPLFYAGQVETTSGKDICAHTVDGRNSAPPWMVETLWIMG